MSFADARGGESSQNEADGAGMPLVGRWPFGIAASAEVD